MSNEIDLKVLSNTLQGYSDIVTYTGQTLFEIADVAQENGNYRIVSMIEELTLRIARDVKEMLTTVKG